MGSDITDTSTKPSQVQTIPEKPPTAGSSDAFKKPKGTSALKTRNGTPLSSASTSKIWKRSSLFSARDQPTLTQIDFVTPISQNPVSDDDLDYIDSEPRKDTEVIEIEDSSDDDDNYQSLSHPQIQRTRFEPNSKSNAVRQKRSTSRQGSETEIKRGRRKSSINVKGSQKKNGNYEKERNKTLTQMDYVRRYLKIEPDEDVKLEYTYITPKKTGNQNSQVKNTQNTQHTHRDQNLSQKTSSGGKKRKLDDEVDPKGTKALTDAQREKQLSQGPITPQKSRRFEIPSSQSPESPGVTMISSSQFRSAARSPLKRVTWDTTKDCIEEVPNSGQEKNASRSPEQKSLFSSDARPRFTIPSSPISHRHEDDEEISNACSATQEKSGNEISASLEDINTRGDFTKQPPSTERTVVYETDADTDYGDSQEESSSIPGSPEEEQDTTNDENHSEDDGDHNLPYNDSQDLPLPILYPELDDETGSLPPETNLSSDASICYQRRQPATQFPLEPIPTLNTQNLAELFPQESAGQQTTTTISPTESSTIIRPPLPDRFSQTQTQTQTQDVDKNSTEIVPESSPIARQGDGASQNDSLLPKHRTQGVVQVESSQPVDKLTRQPFPQGILSRSQLLTSSVMESVPVPGFWMGSQDSVGEPYSSQGK